MAVLDLPLWPFRPNWRGGLLERLAWLTDITRSPIGVEQRRSLRSRPRREFEYDILADQRKRALLDNLLSSKGVHDWLLPLWHEIHYPSRDIAVGDQAIYGNTFSTGSFKAGSIVAITGATPLDYELAEVAGVNATGMWFTKPLDRPWSYASRIYPVARARLTQQPSLARRSDAVVTATVQWRLQEPDPKFVARYVPQDGPLILSGLLASQYQRAQTAGIDPNAGTTDAHAAMAYALLNAGKLGTHATADVREAADWCASLGLDMLDALAGDGSDRGAIMRQAIPANSGVLALPHGAYAARGDTTLHDPRSQGEGFEPLAVLPRLRPGMVSADPAAFAPLDKALTLAMSRDPRQGRGATWSRLRDALRVSNLKGRKTDDGRAVFEPLPGFPAVPGGEAEPRGMFCYSTNLDGGPPLVAGIDRAFTGHRFWSRDTNGDLFGTIPDSYVETLAANIPNLPGGVAIVPADPKDYVKALAISGTEIGRTFPEMCRTGNALHQPDQALLFEVALSRPSNAAIGERFFGYAKCNGRRYLFDIGSRAPMDGTLQRYFARPEDMGAEIVTGVVPDLDPGTTLPRDTVIESFGFLFFAREALVMRVRNVRFLAGPSLQWVQDNVATATRGAVIPWGPGVAPFRISADVGRQAFIGYTGELPVSAQNPDIFATMGSAVDQVYPGLTPEQLPMTDGTGQIVYNLSATTASGRVKGADALLAEQQLRFLNAAQYFHLAYGGTFGAMAETFVRDTMDRRLLGSAAAHSWIYANLADRSDSYYTARVAESAAALLKSSYHGGRYLTFHGAKVTFRGARVVKGLADPDSPLSFDRAKSFEDAAALAEQLASGWLAYVDQAWPNLNGVPRTVPLSGGTGKKDAGLVTYGDAFLTFGSARVTYGLANDPRKFVYGPPSRIGDPRISGPTFEREAPEVAALVIRTALWFRLRGRGDQGLMDRLIARSWAYLEIMWRTIGEMEGTWSSDPARREWYGAWHAEVITTLTEMLAHPELLSGDINRDLVADRFVRTRGWLERYGVREAGSELIATLPETYRGYSVWSRPTNETGDLTIGLERLTSELDNEIALPLQADLTGQVFFSQQQRVRIKGREEDRVFRETLYGLRGRAVPVWMPTGMLDFELQGYPDRNGATLYVDNVGYSRSGGPRAGREHVCIFLYDGTKYYRRILSSSEQNGDTEVLVLDRPLRREITNKDIWRISFMDLVRLDQDSVEISHQADIEGVAIVALTFKSVTGSKQPPSAFRE